VAADVADATLPAPNKVIGGHTFLGCRNKIAQDSLKRNPTAVRG